MDEKNKSMSRFQVQEKFPVKTAILVDGGFYRLRAKNVNRRKIPKGKSRRAGTILSRPSPS